MTSYDQQTLPPPANQHPIAEQVTSLAQLALRSGLSGLVCSVQEVEALRSRSTEAFLVTPGVRMPDDAHGDQKRVDTPASAIRKGSSALVVGRPIVEAKDPVASTERILASIREGGSR